MSRPDLSIVLPCYNEEGNIPLILERFREIIDGSEGIEVVLVDNGSTDDSRLVFKNELSNPVYGFARLVTVEKNRGYGFGIMSGVRDSKGEIIAWTHADMQTDPEDVRLLFKEYGEKIKQGRFYAKGRRIERNFFDTFFTWGMSFLSSLMLGIKIDDVNGQPKMFHRSFLEHLQDAPDDFSLDLYLMYKANELDLTLLTRPVSFAKRRHGEAKGGGTLKGKMKLIIRTFRYILKTKHSVKS